MKLCPILAFVFAGLAVAAPTRKVATHGHIAARDDASLDQTATRTGWYYAKKPAEGDVEKRHEEGEVGVDQTATRTGWYYMKKPEEEEVEKRHEEGEVGVDQTATRTGWYYTKKAEEVTE